ncbi:DNA polymerase [Streptomyces sp. NPDC059708]|uniref:DNA polymerase n=1 Tax=Streptomyces sp. NPDC059708 TaxID=3346916 RepID=UPI0036AC1128
MLTFRGTVGNAPWIGWVVETRDDIPAFVDWLHRNRREVAYDTETTGLQIYSSGFRVRVAQFGTATEAWAIPVDQDPDYYGFIVRSALEHVESLTMHNAPYDWLASDQDSRIAAPLAGLWRKTVDTRALAHLRDSRGRQEGGTGHGLKDLAEQLLDRNATVGELALKDAFREIKATKATGFARIDLWHRDYLYYALLDVILTSRLRTVLAAQVPASARGLVPMETELAFIGASMQKRGFLIDRPYTEKLSAEYVYRYNDACDTAEGLGVENINANMQVIKALIRDGAVIPPPEWIAVLREEKPEEYEALGLDGRQLPRDAIPLGRTASGLPQLDKRTLQALVDRGNPLATAVQAGKRALKWDKSYAAAFLEMADGNDRIHANVNTLLARTARMSVTNPALQTLPSSEWAIRECFIADPGELICGIDYANMELRVIAALAKDPVMMDAFARGEDLHNITAAMAFGPEPGEKHSKRPLGKGANFAKVFGGGWRAIVEQFGAEPAAAKKVVKAFDDTYKGVTAYSKKREAEAKRFGYITTDSGRRLHVDPDRAYSATNYSVQSFARDLMAQGAVKIHREGYLDYMRLIVHDEFVISAPEGDAKEIAHEVGKLMSCSYNGVSIPTDPEVYGRSWGDGYK